jgi:predicted nucleic acid-binding protein
LKRTTVLFPDDLHARVRLEARRRGVAVADGEPADASERVDEFVGKAVARRRRPSLVLIVDASVVALAERHHARVIATLDQRHFSLVRPRHVPAFELVP